MREPVFNRSHSGEDLYAITYMQHQREPGLRHVRSGTAGKGRPRQSLPTNSKYGSVSSALSAEPHISPTDVETVLSGLVRQGYLCAAGHMCARLARKCCDCDCHQC